MLAIRGIFKIVIKHNYSKSFVYIFKRFSTLLTSYGTNFLTVIIKCEFIPQMTDSHLWLLKDPCVSIIEYKKKDRIATNVRNKEQLFTATNIFLI